eukprot:CAMPEP_0172306528 /NCGR_PEP_ID=MMETSP1058-20130122/7582_1 /TAXON_ID=83371 /ORGANISM="Detonula confervacea, Strain CCMP 353" /LENGTH=327 /DNA_ID=CAMNT_0013018447 /DNA_START=23 /DNA_END=1006 /DNA_ORIENTATION=-
MSTPAIFRPYTSYNLFFQLERDYILQTLLGFKPTIASKDMFDPADTMNYQGPPLPSRYSDLILPYDWHLPGKTQRRKRSHRKSHGKIGFHELNEKISKAWSVADHEIRHFCTVLSDSESIKYKKIKGGNKVEKKKVTKRRGKGKKIMAKSAKKKLKDDDRNNNLVASSFDSAVNKFPQDGFARDGPFPDDSNNNSFRKICRFVSCGSSVDDEQEDISLRCTPNLRDSFLSEVDMDDNEIMDIWKSIPIEDKNIPSLQKSPYQNRCMVILNSGSNTTQEKTSEDNVKRMSFIDEEYKRYMEIGKQFSTKQMLLPVNNLKMIARAARQA